MRPRLLLIAAVTLTVGFSGSTSQSRAGRDADNPTAFGRGIYTTTGADYSRIADLGFRTVIVNPTRATLEQIRAYGLTAMVYLGGYNSATCTFSWSDATVEARVTSVRDHPASVMYYLADEPHTATCPDVVQQIRARNQLVKRIDPTASTAIAENRTSDVAALANATDVMILSTYPCSRSNGCVLSKIDAALNTARAANVKHPWGAAQSFGDNYYRVPTPEELQAVIDRWKAGGVQGFFTYTWNCCGDPETLAKHPELWDTWRRENGRRGGHYAPHGDRCVVPRVLGLRLGAAKRKIRLRHCGIGRIRRAHSRRVGRVIGQSPRPGVVRHHGLPVRLVVGQR